MSLEYRVEVVDWPDAVTGASALTALLNDRATDGWRFVSAVPTRAATAVHGLRAPSASADTHELAVVLERDRG
jgi:hypothetical protein